MAKDLERRRQLKSRFENSYVNFEFITGLELRHEDLSDIYVKENKHLTAAEVSCALSHINALEKFLETGEQYALILEDDVIGCDSDLTDIEEIVAKLPTDFFLLCGGQEGLAGKKFQYGKGTDTENVFLIPRVSRRFFTRACCYCVSVQSAQRILEMQRKVLRESDDWGRYFSKWKSFYFSRKLSHPMDLRSSNIELGRSAAQPRNEWIRIRRHGVSHVLSRFVGKLAVRHLSRFMGWVQVR